MKPVFEEKAKEKQREAGGTVPQKSAKQPIETRNEIAKLAGVSHDTIARVQKIEVPSQLVGMNPKTFKYCKSVPNNIPVRYSHKWQGKGESEVRISYISYQVKNA